MINLSTKKFLRILFSFVGLAYLMTFLYSIITTFQASTPYEIGSATGYNLGVMTYYLVLFTMAFTALYLFNSLVNRIRFSNS